MKADVEMSLAHDGSHWICMNERFIAKGDTFGALDKDIQRKLKASGRYPDGTCVTVFMGFDFDTIPNWLRQYHSHYFNRSVQLEL